METPHLITFSLLILTSVMIVLLTAKEEIKQSKITKTTKNKNNFWMQNKYKTTDGQRELKILLLFISFVAEILFLHYIA